MKKIFKPTWVAAPAILALAACDSPPAEAPPVDDIESGADMMEAPAEPLDTMPMGEAPVDGNLKGGAAPADELPADGAVPPANQSSPPAGETGMTDDNSGAAPAE